jgi:putative chitinase
MINKQQLLHIMPHCDPDIWLGSLNAAMAEFGINTGKRMAMFLAHVAHESDECHHLEENLNYSEKGLLQEWPSRFTKESAKIYAHIPQAIANTAYSNRMGNGPDISGDGWKYRGRGLFQITGKDNYRDCGEALNLPLISQPRMLTEIHNAARSAGWFFIERADGIKWADCSDLKSCTKRINGGDKGLAERSEYYDRACEVLEVLS